MRAWTLVVLGTSVGCGTVEAPGDAVDAAGATSADATTPPEVDAAPDAAPVVRRDCAALRASEPAAPSGRYTIDPDAPGGDEPIEVFCDMDTRGGGWTVIFLAEQIDYSRLPIDYQVGSLALLDGAEDVLLAFRHVDLTPYPNEAVLALPEAWRRKSPFGAADVNVDLAVQVSVAGEPAVPATLRYGRATFPASCAQDWNPAADFGRLCITGTKAPFWSGYAVVASQPNDWCSESDGGFTTKLCGNDRRFSIAVR